MVTPSLCLAVQGSFFGGLERQEQVINSKSEVTTLASALSRLESSVPTPTTYASVAAGVPPSNSSPFNAPIVSRLPSLVSHNFQDRKFNLIIHGQDECPSGTPRHSRLSKDLEAVGVILSSVVDSVDEHSIRDCFWLGRYVPGCKHPILVKLNRSCEVSSMLCKRSRLKDHPGISVRPDLPKGNRVALHTQLTSGFVDRCLYCRRLQKLLYTNH